ncbi:hypothetical protein P43SY_001817 [Pythium insidiosum]|uniref:Uncharacterized protein n=1 Tax=Pythium insidiosum TaxID=114742 RepID=A0AAD5M1T1_PYTIN|nr:hypothetical protein P43SY_001817 [Pythium insidiosum]
MSPASAARHETLEGGEKAAGASAVSVAAKLFGKSVESASVGLENGARESPEDQADDDEDDEDEEGGRRREMDDLDEEDDEYVPSEDDSDAGERRDGGEDESEEEEEDETPSVRSLLPLRLPLTLSRRRRVSASRSAEEEQEQDPDDGDFDAQDAELWGSRSEKQAWIERFERANAEFIEQYGCRIDSAAHPDASRRLRRERRREGPYSLLLLALVVAYGIHLTLFPFEDLRDLQPQQIETKLLSPAEPSWFRWSHQDIIT